jgi:hypothetical protein
MKTILMQEHPMIFNLQYGFKLLRNTIESCDLGLFFDSMTCDGVITDHVIDMT